MCSCPTHLSITCDNCLENKVPCHINASLPACFFIVCDSWPKGVCEFAFKIKHKTKERKKKKGGLLILYLHLDASDYVTFHVSSTFLHYYVKHFNFHCA